jgi:hypothetical protein
MAARQSLTSTHAIEKIVYEGAGEASGSTPALITALYRKRACSADAIVIGHPVKWQYHLSASGTSIYGDYDFAVESMLKDTSAAPHIKTHIVVTQPGGTMTLGTGAISEVKVIMESFPQLPDQSYLILLQYIEASGTFQGVDAFATLVRSGSVWMIARKAFSALSLPLFEQGTFEPAIQ